MTVPLRRAVAVLRSTIDALSIHAQVLLVRAQHEAMKEHVRAAQRDLTEASTLLDQHAVSPVPILVLGVADATVKSATEIGYGRMYASEIRMAKKANVAKKAKSATRKRTAKRSGKKSSKVEKKTVLAKKLAKTKRMAGKTWAAAERELKREIAKLKSSYQSVGRVYRAFRKYRGPGPGH